MRLVKRYSNRKLYDTKQRHYVTLSDLAQIVRSGETLQIRDYETSADITAQTLAQIVYEEEKRAPRVSAETFVAIIRTGGLKQAAA